MKGCDKRPGSKAAIGQDCDADADCQSGLECTSDGCMIIGAGGTEVPEFDPQTGGFVETEEPERDEPGEFNPTFVQLGFTVGLAYLQAGMVADRPAPENRVFINELNQYVEDPFSAAMMGTRLFFPEPGTPSETQVTAWVPDADSADANGPLEGNCSADGEVTDPALYAMSVAAGTPNPDLVLPSRYCVRVKNPGFVPNIALRAAIGHFITPEISLAAVLRFQFSAGEGTLPNMLIGARGEYLLTAPKSRGLMISAFAGATFGEIQAQPPADGETEGAPYVRSGLFGMHVGATFRYRLSPSFGFFAAPEVDIQLPTTLFNVDLTLAGLEAAF
jgi:hypothetical protein